MEQGLDMLTRLVSMSCCSDDLMFIQDMFFLNLSLLEYLFNQIFFYFILFHILVCSLPGVDLTQCAFMNLYQTS